MVLANQAKWRCKYNLSINYRELTVFLAHGLWGQAKFQNADSAPFAALVCLSLSK